MKGSHPFSETTKEEGIVLKKPGYNSDTDTNCNTVQSDFFNCTVRPRSENQSHVGFKKPAVTPKRRELKYLSREKTR